MKSPLLSRLAFAIGLVLGLGLWSGPAAAALPSVEAFFKNPERAGMSLSPSGRYLAALAPFNGRMNIFVVDTQARQGNWVTGFKDEDVTNIIWANDERLLFNFGRAAQGATPELIAGLFSVHRSGRELKVLVTPEFGRRYTRFLSLLSDNDEEMLVVSNDRFADYPDVYRMRLNRPGKIMEVRNPGKVITWLADHQGQVRVGITGPEDKSLDTSVIYREPGAGEWKTLATFKYGLEVWLPLGFDFDNRTLLVASRHESDKRALHRYDPVSQTMGAKIYGRDDVDVEGLIFSSKRQQLVGVYYNAVKPAVHWLDPHYATIQKELDALFPGAVNQWGPGNRMVGSGHALRSGFSDAAETRYMVYSGSSRDPGAFFFFDPKQMEIQKLADTRPWLKPAELSEMEPVTIRARDGRDLPGYLMMPPGKSRADRPRVPLILNPHGGPWARDGYGFDPETQFFASRGFAVLRVNFRGSEGYGYNHLMAGRRQLGRAMQDDLTDAVRWAIDQGIADADNVGIYGASYGGYATMVGLTQTPELYRWGINYVGVVDLNLHIKWYKKIERDFAYDYWKYMVGDPVAEADMLAQVSPLNYVDRIKVPLFVIHGMQDVQVDVDQSFRLMKALDSKGIPYRRNIRKDEGHGYRKEENRIELYKQIDEFLKPFAAVRE